MNVHLAARSLCTKILATLMESARAERVEPKVAPEALAEERSEFEEFLTDLGSEPPDMSAANDSVLKDATIAELTARLQDLQPLGDRLAAAEQERLAAVARIEELESAATSEVQANELEKKVASLTRARDRQTERLDRMRCKFEERKRVAADRWREILELKREIKALKRQG